MNRGGRGYQNQQEGRGGGTGQNQGGRGWGSGQNQAGRGDGSGQYQRGRGDGSGQYQRGRGDGSGQYQRGRGDGSGQYQRSRGDGSGQYQRSRGDFRGTRGDFRGTRGDFRGTRGGPGRAPAMPEVQFRDPNADPYLQCTINRAKLIKEAVWKPFEYEQKELVELHKRTQDDPAEWAARTVSVSVNHFLVNGIPKKVYQYDINCELKRASNEDDDTKRKPKPKRKQPLPLEVGLANENQPQPRKIPKELIESILKWLIPKMRKESKHYAMVTNFSQNLYTTKPLEDLKGVHLKYEFTAEELKNAKVITDRENADERDNTLYVVSFQFANNGETGGIINTELINQYFNQYDTLQGFEFTPDLKQTLEAFYNAVLKNIPRFDFYSVGRSTIIPHNAPTSSLGEGIEAWKGVNVNIAMGWKPYMNLELSNVAMVMGASVFTVMKDILRERRTPNPAVEDVTQIQHHLPKLRTFLKTTKVKYSIPGGPVFTKTVRDISDYGANDSRTRFDFEGKQITVFEYFHRKYGVRLNHPNGPLLVVSASGTKVPAELCIIKKGQSVNRKLSGQQTDNMLQVARKSPQDHYGDIIGQFRTLGFDKSPVLNGFGMQIPDVGMLKIDQARVLVPPTIQYGEGAHISPREGIWDIWRQPKQFEFYKTPKTVVEKWGILTVGCSAAIETVNRHLLDNFLNFMVDHGKRKGVELPVSPMEPVFDYQCTNGDNAAPTNVKIIKGILKRFKDQKCQFVLVVIPAKNDPLYGHVKHAAELEVGILTQCVQLKSVVGTDRKPGPSPSLVQNVLLKLNMKLGGINHVTVPPLDPQLSPQFSTLFIDCPILVIGADVTHPPPGANKFFVKGEEEGYSPSYAAVTGSYGRTTMPYMTELRAQRKAGAGAAEVIQDLESIVAKMIKYFFLQSGGKMLPLKIIYFRDGVGSGQFKEVVFDEMMAIRRACESTPAPSVMKVLGKTEYQPSITFITVQKRHKTRMFLHDGSLVNNVPAGTVIDQEIVHPNEIGFYLTSHYGALGTSRPTHYRVLWDDSDFSLDEIQSFTFTLCHMFARCTRSVKMPAPTYYAHLAADRAKKLCEGMESKIGEPTPETLNRMLTTEVERFRSLNPMYFI